MSSNPSASVVATAPAKVNLILRVGAPDSTGFHPLTTVFQAVDIWDEVSVSPAGQDQLVVGGPGDNTGVPTDETNIVWRAVEAMEKHGVARQPLRIRLTKTIPVAGGMAGGSANAAATLVALNELWGVGLSTSLLLDMAATIGADVPFSLHGGLALGQGRGDQLTALTRVDDLHLVVVTSPFHLSTPLVYQTLDILRGGVAAPLPKPLAVGAPTLGSVNPEQLVHRLANDLQGPAVHVAPQVGVVLRAVTDAGALASLVSGSGPTVWGVCRDAAHAGTVASDLLSQGADARATVSTPRGAHLVTGLFSSREGH